MTITLTHFSSRPKWALQKAYLWGRSVFELDTTDLFLACYPKTGSTWVRIFLYNLLKCTDTVQQLSFDDLDRDMPEFANRSFFNSWKFVNSPRLVKTHSQYRPIFKRNRSILFARNPRDTMVSFLHYANASHNVDFSGDLCDLVHHHSMGLDSYFRFYNSWLPQAGHIMKYEDLRSDPCKEFRRLVDFIGIVATDSEILAAIEASTLDKTRTAQARSSIEFNSQFTDNFNFAREGKIGASSQIFDQKLELALQEKLDKHKFNLYQ